LIASLGGASFCDERLAAPSLSTPLPYLHPRGVLARGDVNDPLCQLVGAAGGRLGWLVIAGLSVWALDQFECGNVGASRPRLQYSPADFAGYVAAMRH
jgi:hypothetical protein